MRSIDDVITAVDVDGIARDEPWPRRVRGRNRLTDLIATILLSDWAKKSSFTFARRPRLVEMAEAKPELRDRQPWKAAYERDYGWLGALMAEHYAGDDSNVQILAAGILAVRQRVRFGRLYGGEETGRTILQPLWIVLVPLAEVRRLDHPKTVRGKSTTCCMRRKQDQAI
jgi:hypothetical protein